MKPLPLMTLIRVSCRRAIETTMPSLSYELLATTWQDIQTEQVTDFLEMMRAREE